MPMDSNILTTISELDNAGVQIMLDELATTFPDIFSKFNSIVQQTGLSGAEVLEYIVLSSPRMFAKAYLGWEARDYQVEMVDAGGDASKLVLRLGRRLGKSEVMCILILWYAYVQPNRGPNENQYNVLIVTPFEEQIDLIFDRLHQLIDASPVLSKCVARDIHHRVELTNGAIIKGLTAGSKSNTGAASTRGQRADIIILDEVDYMGSSEITNILNIRNEAPGRIRIIAASTPAGKREEYYNWCMNASLTMSIKEEDIKKRVFTSYNRTKQKGNGWIQIYAPSSVNKELLKINPDTGRMYIEDLEEELTDMRFKQEVMAEFGEEAMGVYQKKYIDLAIKEGDRCNHRYTTEYTPEELEVFLAQHRSGPRILGVDWDKRGASTNMVCIELDTEHRDDLNNKMGIFKVLFRVEIPRSEFTYTNAVTKIIELNKIYDFDWIAVDRGAGETQVELLHKEGMKEPWSGLHEKVIGVNFSEKIVVRDPYTHVKDKKKIKPFMVNNSVIIFERQAIMLHPHDKKLVKQFEDYKIKTVSQDGTPTYVDTNEHIVDAVNLALYMFEQKYGELLKKMTSNKIMLLPRMHNIVNSNINVKARDIADKKDQPIISMLGTNPKNGYISTRVQKSSLESVKRAPIPTRRMF